MVDALGVVRWRYRAVERVEIILGLLLRPNNGHGWRERSVEKLYFGC